MQIRIPQSVSDDEKPSRILEAWAVGKKSKKKRNPEKKKRTWGHASAFSTAAEESRTRRQTSLTEQNKTSLLENRRRLKRTKFTRQSRVRRAIGPRQRRRANSIIDAKDAHMAHGRMRNAGFESGLSASYHSYKPEEET